VKAASTGPIPFLSPTPITHSRLMKNYPFKIFRHMLQALATSLLATLVLATVSFSSYAGVPVQIHPGQGVEFVQVDFIYGTELVVSNSDTGQMIVDPAAVVANSGKPFGYINVGTSDGWVAYNLPIVSNFPYASIRTAFKLPTPSGVPLTMLGAYVLLSDEPLTSFTGGSFDYWPVGKSTYNAGGVVDQPPSGPILPPAANLTATYSGPNKTIAILCQPSHPNVQAANNQCWPCAVANSLQWLENLYGIVVPHDDVPGIYNVSSNKFFPPNSLPAQLDYYMQRNASSRTVGNPTIDQFALKGKLAYMVHNGLGGLIVQHQALALDMTANFTTNGLTSTFMGPPTFEFILTNLLNGADVELAYDFFPAMPGIPCPGPGTGCFTGHAGDVVAAGFNTTNQPYIMFASDMCSTDVDTNDNKGTSVDYTLVTGPDGCGYYHLPSMPSGAPNGPIIKVVVAGMPSPGMLNEEYGQLPGCRLFLNSTNAFGGDRASDFNWSSPQGSPAIADDFLADGRPIVKVRWWGSYLNGHNLGDEDAFVLSLYTDFPTNTFSRPAACLCATYIAPLDKISVTNTFLAGLDGKTIYEYSVDLCDTCLYSSITNGPAAPTPWAFLEMSNTVYWLAIEAERGRTFTFTTNAVWTNYPSGKSTLSEHFWGWHTSPCSNLDASVTGALTTNLSWTMNTNLFGELDQAFELLTFAPPLSALILNTLWSQRPDWTCDGVAVLTTDGSGSQIVADDFAAYSTNRISCYYIWGAWLNDRYDPNASFRLRIYSDVPASGNQPSHPGTKLWEKTFTVPPTNTMQATLTSNANYWSATVIASNLCESFWDPSQSAGMGNATKDSRLYQYRLYMPTNYQFIQTNGQIYWLSVTALNTTNRFGWKTTITNDHHMDDAVFATQSSPPASGWTNLHYPTNHPFAGQTMDMAFALTTPLIVSCSYSCGGITLSRSPLPPESVTLSGSSTWLVDVGPAGEACDTDTNGLDDVSAEIVQLTLSGTSSLGPVTVRIRDQNQSPYQPSLGRIEEMINSVTNRLDVPPFAPSGYANSFFDVYLEVQIGTNILHSAVPVQLSAMISSVPPPISEGYNSSISTIQLLDENNNPSGYSLQELSYIPETIPPPVITGISVISPGLLEITWENGGGLQASPRLDGPSWTTITTNSPYIGPITGMMQFYRVYQP